MGRIGPPDRAVIAKEDDHAVVRNFRDGEPDGVCEGLRVVDRRVEGRACVGQEAPTAGGTGPPDRVCSPIHPLRQGTAHANAAARDLSGSFK